MQHHALCIHSVGYTLILVILVATEFQLLHPVIRRKEGKNKSFPFLLGCPDWLQSWCRRL